MFDFEGKLELFNSLKIRLEEVKANVNSDNFEWYETLKEIYSIATRLDTISGFKFSSLCYRIKRVLNTRSHNVLDTCIDFVDFMVKRTDEFLEMEMVNEIIEQKKNRKKKECVA